LAPKGKRDVEKEDLMEVSKSERDDNLP
jgi:hypothetical protein